MVNAPALSESPEALPDPLRVWWILAGNLLGFVVCLLVSCWRLVGFLLGACWVVLVPRGKIVERVGRWKEWPHIAVCDLNGYGKNSGWKECGKNCARQETSNSQHECPQFPNKTSDSPAKIQQVFPPPGKPPTNMMQQKPHPPGLLTGPPIAFCGIPERVQDARRSHSSGPVPESSVVCARCHRSSHKRPKREPARQTLFPCHNCAIGRRFKAKRMGWLADLSDSGSAQCVGRRRHVG